MLVFQVELFKALTSWSYLEDNWGSKEDPAIYCSERTLNFLSSSSISQSHNLHHWLVVGLDEILLLTAPRTGLADGDKSVSQPFKNKLMHMWFLAQYQAHPKC